MSAETFLHMLRRYRQQACTPDEIEQIDQWYDRLRSDVEPLLSPDERLTLQQYLWQRIERRLDVSEAHETPASVQATPFAAVRLDNQERISTSPVWSRPTAWRWAVAAVVVLLGVGVLLTYRLGDSSRPSSPLNRGHQAVLASPDPFPTDWTNNTDQSQTIALVDGSTVRLEPGSRLQHPAKTNTQKREVWLTGRAFFTVQRDEARPFLVYTGAVVTRVLGTSFWVNAPANAPAVDVSVCTGRVWVSRRTGAQVAPEKTTASGQGVVLTPNQQVTFYTDRSQWDTGLVAEPHPLKTETIPSPARFVFDESPLTDVLKSLENQYGIVISAPDETLENCRFTGDISQQSFYTQLELVCRSINASYEVIGTQIIISGSGCTPI